MFEVKELQQDIDNCRDDLLRAMVQSSERAEIGRENEKKAKSLDSDLQTTVKARDLLRESMNHMVKIYKNIEQYAHDRRELSIEMLKTAIHNAGYIVPAADTEGIELSLKEGKAKIINKLGQDINKREGSAYRTVVGMLVRYTLLKEKPGCLQAIFLDEAFNTLSDETTNAMRDVFDVFKEDTLIVGIEQHDTLFQGLDTSIINVIKGKDKVTVVMSESKKGEGLDAKAL